VRADSGSGHAGQRQQLAWADGGGGWPLGAGQRPGEAPSRSGLAAAPREAIGRARPGDGQSWPGTARSRATGSERRWLHISKCWAQQLLGARLLLGRWYKTVSSSVTSVNQRI
jgi:hypothetical protein